MPRDRGYGVCGCPDNFDWIRPRTDPDTGEIIPGFCNARFQRCGYVEERNVCTNLRDILNNLAECLFGGPESKEANRGNLPYEQACCPYIDYDNQEYYQFEDVVVY